MDGQDASRNKTTADDVIRVVAVSDTHGFLPEVPKCDLLLLAGDITPLIEKKGFARQAAWLDGDFRHWLLSVPADEVVFVPGNHDTIYEWASNMVPRGLRCRTLIDEGFEFRGLKVYGTPWQPWFWDWAFNAHEEKLKSIWARIPDDTDILVLHGPPHGLGDYVDGENPGSPSLLARIEEVRPALAVYGHIHVGRGLYEIPERLGARSPVLANVAAVDERYKLIHPPVSFRLANANGVWYASPERGGHGQKA